MTPVRGKSRPFREALNRANTQICTPNESVSRPRTYRAGRQCSWRVFLLPAASRHRVHRARRIVVCLLSIFIRQFVSVLRAS